jgi:hypothetical protein
MEIKIKHGNRDWNRDQVQEWGLQSMIEISILDPAPYP